MWPLICVLPLPPQVITSTTQWAQRRPHWQYGSGASFCQQSGSANNWAHGFNLHGSRYGDEVLDLVRKVGQRTLASAPRSSS